MATSQDIVVLSAVRTAIGTYGGSLKNSAPTDLAALVVREAVDRAGVAGRDIGHAVFGQVIHTDVHDMYLARVAAIKGGLPVETPALTLNRLCGSGLQAIVTAAQMIMLGDASAAVAGGAEVMSRGQYWVPGLRWGQRMNDGAVIDAVVGAISDPFDDCHMGVTAEHIARTNGITREDQDRLALESHKRAANAIAQGYFTTQIVPVDIPTKKGVQRFERDEHVRPDTTMESLAKLKPAFDRDGTVTAGNAAGINDAAAAVVLMAAGKAADLGLHPLARLVAYAHAGVEPKLMGLGPVPAVRAVLDRAGLQIKDMDVIELNEAFAAQALAVMRTLDLPFDRTNPNGSGIALGHPIGATGAILTVKALHELHRTGGRFALVTMCIGGGQGIAAIYERL
jgi:acetyl-CoA C-acetyltransferase